MRYLILSDIHANLEALDAVLSAAASRAYDRVLVLGDLVGYGADPNTVVERVQELPLAAIIRGNHDKVACGLEDASGFNPIARHAAEWTRETLTPANQDYLRRLPSGPIQVDELVEICHGAPFDEDAYLFDEIDALRALKDMTRPLCLFGHTHFPVIFQLSDQGVDASFPNASNESSFKVREGRFLVNPGAVGQPRDGDPRAAYALVDSSAREFFLYRVEYETARAHDKVVAAGLPEALADRLWAGR